MSKHATAVKEKAILLRSQGYSVKEIAEKLGISRSTSSLWARGIRLDKKAKSRLNERRLLSYYKSGLRWEKKRMNEEALYESQASDSLKGINRERNHAKLYCSLLYWCEGGKHYSGPVSFINSDPTLIKTFLKLLRESFELEESRFRILLHLHSYHKEKNQKKFWSGITGIPEKQFYRSYLKQNTSRRVRENYPGCAVVYYNDRRVARQLRAVYNSFSKIMGA